MYGGQTAGWIKMPLGMKVGLGPGDIMLDGDPAPPNTILCNIFVQNYYRQHCAQRKPAGI